MLNFVVITFESWLALHLIWHTVHLKQIAESLIWGKRNIRGYTHNLTSIQGLLSAFRTFPALDLVLILQTHPGSVCAEIQELWSKWEQHIYVQFQCRTQSVTLDLCFAKQHATGGETSWAVESSLLHISFEMHKKSLMWFYGLLNKLSCRSVTCKFVSFFWHTYIYICLQSWEKSGVVQAVSLEKVSTSYFLILSTTCSKSKSCRRREIQKYSFLWHIVSNLLQVTFATVPDMSSKADTVLNHQPTCRYKQL